MSYQPGPPGAPQAFTPTAPAAPVKGPRKPALIGVGALLLAAGVVGGIVMFLASGSNYDDGVKNLARAPLGCTTELEFASSGTFHVYVETTGTIGELRGDCPNTDTDYSFDGDGTPDVDVVLTDDNGDEVDVTSDDSLDYDAAGAKGTSIGTVEIDDPGTYQITATSDEDGFVVAVGKDPKGSADTLAGTAVIVLVAGLLVGGLLLVLGLRRGKPTVPPATMTPGGGFGGGYAPAPSTGYAPAPPTTGYPPVNQPLPPTVQQPTAPAWPPAPPAPPAPPTGPSGPQWPAPPTG